MAELIDLSTFTSNPQEALDANMMIFEEVTESPEINNVHNIMTGIQMNQYIPILGQFGLFLKKDPGSCGVNNITAQVPTSEKEWTPVMHSSRLTHCQDSVPDLFKAWKKALKAANVWEEVPAPMKQFLADRIVVGMNDEILRIVDFSDTAENVIAQGGHLTAGSDKTYFNTIDGMWKQIFAHQATATPKTKRYEITANAGATYVDQANLGSDEALKIFRYLYNNIDPRAKKTQLKYQITESLFTNWQDFLEDKSQVFQLDRTENGATLWKYRGIPIEVRYDWSQVIHSYFDNGTSYHLPHRGILTDINNIPIGTSDEESFKSFDWFYWKKDKAHYTDIAMRLDVKVLLEYMIAVAY